MFIASVLPRSEKTLGPEDEDQHQEEVRKDRGDLRDGQLEQLVAEGLLGHRHAEGLQAGGERLVHGHREGLHDADDQRGQEGAGQRAHAADHAREACERGAAAEHEAEDARHVVAQRLDHLGVLQRRLDDQADAGAGEREPDGDQHRHRHQHHEAAIDRVF